MKHGHFHTDPHPGNFMVANDGKLVLLDWGQTKRVSEVERMHMCRLSLYMANILLRTRKVGWPQASFSVASGRARQSSRSWGRGSIGMSGPIGSWRARSLEDVGSSGFYAFVPLDRRLAPLGPLARSFRPGLAGPRDPLPDQRWWVQSKKLAGTDHFWSRDLWWLYFADHYSGLSWRPSTSRRTRKPSTPVGKPQ